MDQKKNEVCFRANLFILRAIIMRVATETSVDVVKIKVKIRELYRVIGTTRENYTRICKEYDSLKELPQQIIKNIKGIPDLYKYLIFDEKWIKKQDLQHFCLYRKVNSEKGQTIIKENEQTAHNYWVTCFSNISNQQKNRTLPSIMREMNSKWEEDIKLHISEVIKRNETSTDIVYKIYSWLKKRADQKNYNFEIQHEKLEELKKIDEFELKKWNIGDLMKHMEVAKDYYEFVNAVYIIRKASDKKS